MKAKAFQLRSVTTITGTNLREYFLEMPSNNRDAKGNTRASFLTHAIVYTCKDFIDLRIFLRHRE